MSKILEIVLEALRQPQIEIENKELLIGKLEDASCFKEAYMTEEEKELVNEILRKKKIPCQVS